VVVVVVVGGQGTVGARLGLCTAHPEVIGQVLNKAQRSHDQQGPISVGIKEHNMAQNKVVYWAE
jgi:hypothetical protein